MLAQVNARMQAKRGGRGGLLGWENDEGFADQGGHGASSAEHVIAPNRVRNLAEKHGIVVKFVDDGAASGVAQVRALARAHRIRIQILGEDSGDDGGEEEDEGGDVDTPAGGRGGLRVGGNESPTPPPVLSSLRSRVGPARRSPSPVPQTLPKVPRRFEKKQRKGFGFWRALPVVCVWLEVCTGVVLLYRRVFVLRWNVEAISGRVSFESLCRLFSTPRPWPTRELRCTMVSLLMATKN